MSFSFSSFVSSLNIFQVLKCVCLFFQVFQCFSSYSRFYSVCVSFSTFFSFLTIIQVVQCVFLIFHVFTVSRHFPGPTVYVSYFPPLSVFSPYPRSYSVCFSFCTFSVFISHFSVFLNIFQVLPCDFLIFLVCQFSRHIPGPTVFVSFSMIVRFLTICQVIQCIFLIFHNFQCFSPYCRSYSV